MGDFEASPRPTKRQKTTKDAQVSLSTRAFRAVKGAVFGQSFNAQTDGAHDGGEDELAQSDEVDGPSTLKKDDGGSIWSKPLSTFERWKLSRQKNNAQFGRKGANPSTISGSILQTPKKRKRRKSAETEAQATPEEGIGGKADGEKEPASTKTPVKRARHADLLLNGDRGTADDPDPIQSGSLRPTGRKSTSPGRSSRRPNSSTQDRNTSSIGRKTYTNGATPEPQTPSRNRGGRDEHTGNHRTTTDPSDELERLARDAIRETEDRDSELRSEIIPEPSTAAEEFLTPNKRSKRISQAPSTPNKSSPLVVIRQSRSPSPRPVDHAKILLDSVSSIDPKTLTTFKQSILSQLTSPHCLPLQNLHTEYQKVHALLSQTILAGEGNSMLVIGSRGSGKTTLVEKCLSDLESEHREDFHVVRLNGFIQTDDKLALREIWRQLGRDMSLEDEVGRSNYADALSSLLALLSHSPEAGDGNDVKSKAIVFVLDEFDLFASHPRQTLLYNLFDVAQSCQAPIAVLGLTTKINVVEMLEKRVKSRFSQRYIHVSLPKSFAIFSSTCKAALLPPKPISTRLHPDLEPLTSAWENYITDLFTTPTMNTHLRTIYSTTASLPTFLSSALIPLSTLSPTCLPTASSFLTNPLTPPDSKLHLLPALSDLALALLIAAARLDVLLDSDLCTFALAYDEYVALASRLKQQTSAAGQLALSGGGRVWSRTVARAEWERLVEWELVLPATNAGVGVGKAPRGEMERVWRVDVALEEIGPSVPGMGKVMARWCREI